MHLLHDDGTEIDMEPGSVYQIGPGHDVWVVGDEPAVGVKLDSQTASSFAKP